MNKSFVAANAAIFVLCIVLLLAIWFDSLWIAVVSGLLLAALCVWFAVELYHEKQRAQKERQAFAKETQRLQEEKNECRKACVEEQTQFYSAFSHSVRMPLSIIKGYAELLASGDIIQEDEPKYLQKIIERCQSIVDFFPKIQENLELKELQDEMRTPQDLFHLVQECTQEIKNGMCFDSIRIQVLSQQENLMVLCKPERINEIIYNLLENASKYMQRPGIITFRLWKDLGMVHIHIRDDGMGLRKEEAARIFEKSYQGSNQKGGRGYGLYWVQQIVLAYGGRIWAESDMGKGMSIHIVLPEYREQTDESTMQSEECVFQKTAL